MPLEKNGKQVMRFGAYFKKKEIFMYFCTTIYSKQACLQRIYLPDRELRQRS